MWIIVIVLAVACLLLTGYLAALLKEVQRMGIHIEQIATEQTNAQVYTLVGNRYLKSLAAQINRLLAVQKERDLAVKRADSAFKESVTGISHDLRTPLTSISGYLQLLKGGKASPEKQVEYWSTVERRLAALLSLLDELFEYTRLEAGQLAAEPEKLMLNSLLLEQLAQYYEVFTQQGMEPEVDVPEQPCQVFCDRKSLERVVQNLIKNGLVHGKGRLLVSLLSYPDTGTARLTFSNLADPAQVDPGRLFERFYTADQSRSGKSSGLGLAIVRQLVEGMDGKAGARWSENNGDLLEIFVELPLAAP